MLSEDLLLAYDLFLFLSNLDFEDHLGFLVLFLEIGNLHPLAWRAYIFTTLSLIIDEMQQLE